MFWSGYYYFRNLKFDFFQGSVLILLVELAVPNLILHRRDGLTYFTNEKYILSAFFLQRLYSPARAGVLF